MENTLILRGFHRNRTPKGPFSHAYLHGTVPKWPKHGYHSSYGERGGRGTAWPRVAIGNSQLANRASSFKARSGQVPGNVGCANCQLLIANCSRALVDCGAIMIQGETQFELRDLRDSQGKTLLPRGARAHLSAMLWRAARSDIGLSQRLSVFAAGART